MYDSDRDENNVYYIFGFYLMCLERMIMNNRREGSIEIFTTNHVSKSISMLLQL